MPTEKNTEEEITFTAKKVGVKKTDGKKIIRRKTWPSRQNQKKPISNSRSVSKIKNQELNKRLNSIYQDADGKIPNMREIRVKKSHPVVRSFFTLLIVGGLMAAAAWAGFFYLSNHKSDKNRQMDLAIDGPTEVEFGATTTYKINFKNNEKIGQKNVVISVNYPAGFVFLESSAPATNPGNTEWSIGDIGASKKDSLTIIGKNFNEPGQENSWRVFINYTPENFNSEMQEISTLTTKINESPFKISIKGPEKTLVGNDTEYIFTIDNLDKNQNTLMELVPGLPEGFLISSSFPKLDKDNKWLIDKNNPEIINEFKLTGKFSNASESVLAEKATIKAAIFVPYEDKTYLLAKNETQTEVGQNKYSLNLAVNGVLTNLGTRPDEILNITAQLKNTGEETIHDAKMILKLDAPSLNNKSSLNWSALTDELNGDIIGAQLSDTERRGQITWNKKQLNTLAEIKPGEEVSIDIQIPIQSAKNFDISELKNFIITAVTEATFMDDQDQEKTISGNKIEITINSDLAIETRSKNITEDGIGKKQITWILTNSTHPLKNVSVSADLMGNTQFINPDPQTIPAGEIKFDEEKNKVIWTIPEMPLEMDTVALTFEVVILKKDPTQKTVVSKASLSAEDAVTNQIIYLMGEEVEM
jgi:hypothetical protein